MSSFSLKQIFVIMIVGIMGILLLLGNLGVGIAALDIGRAHYNMTIKTNLGSSILWINSYHTSDNNNNSSPVILVQTKDGNVHQLSIGNDGIISDSRLYNVSASSESGGPVVADLDSDKHIEILSISTEGNLAVIEQEGSNNIGWFNETKLSSITQPVTLSNYNEQQSLFAISENRSLLEFNSNVTNTVKNDNYKPLDLIMKSHKFDNILPDSKITVSDTDKDGTFEILVLSNPVTFYPHGALGDELEPTQLYVIGRCGESYCLRSNITAPQGKVFEAIAPLVFSNGNNDNYNDTGSIHSSVKVALVASNKEVGSNLLIYSMENSSIIYSGEPIGIGFKWMLVLGIIEDFSKGQRIIVNETPHLSGIVKFIDPQDPSSDNNKIEKAGFSAHTFGSRNIAMYAIVDIDNDQNKDNLIIPNLEKDRLEILSLTNNNSVLNNVGSLHLESILSSNIHTTDIDKDNSLDIIAGDKSGMLYIFSQNAVLGMQK